MPNAERNQRWSRWLVDELIRGGAGPFCVSPGSRSAPLALAVAERDDARAAVLVDERVAGFVGLGAGKAGMAPAVLVCTSGSAAANYLPAIVEAHYSRTPLIILTTDRPPELRDTGAWQAIDQLKLYGDYVRWFFELGTPTDEPRAADYVRSVAARLVATAAGAANPPGPVHLNLAFREPLVDSTSLADTASPTVSADGATAKKARPWTAHRPAQAAPRPSDVAEVAALVRRHPHGLILAGRQRLDPGTAPAIARLAAATGYPLLADAGGGLRFGAHDRRHVISRYEALVRAQDWSARARPTLIIQLGSTFTWKQVAGFLKAAAPDDYVMVDGTASFDDPERQVTTFVHGAPELFAAMLAEHADAAPGGELPDGAARRAWLERWQRADAAAAAVQEAVVAEDRWDTVIPYWPSLLAALPDESNLLAANSMAVRDLDSFAGASARPIHVYSNRGAAGIDGNISTALGVGWATGRPTVAVVGDLALLHDLGALAAGLPIGAPLAVVCFNDHGGGIFEYLPVAEAPRPRFERFFASPAPLKLEHLAAAVGVDFRAVRSPRELGDALRSVLRPKDPGIAVVEVPIDRAANTAAHRAYWRQVAAALG